MTAIIVPYRDRPTQLSVFLQYMVQIGLPIVIVNQQGNARFNRGKLLNIGAHWAFNNGFDHVILHDVDMLPVEFGYYHEKRECAHLCHYASQFRQPLGPLYFGGVNMFSKECFTAINGFSNNFWGWGGEDNDLLNRCIFAGYKPEYLHGIYESLMHAPANKDRYDENKTMFMRHKNRPEVYQIDGLRNVQGIQFEQHSMDKYTLLNVTL